MVQSRSQLQRRTSSWFEGDGYRCDARLLGTSGMHIVVVNDLPMAEDVP